MRASRKIESKLFEVVSLNLKNNVECIAYVSDFNKARNFFGDEIVMELPIIGAVALKTNSSKLIDGCNKSWIKSVTRQTNVLALMNTARKILTSGNGLSGEGVTVAYIDTGIAPHLDFMLKKDRIISFIDLVSNKKRPYDDNGHGTFVAGVGSGNGIMSGGKFSGIAPKSNIISIKALNGDGEANAVNILEAMQWIYDNAKKFNIKIVCMSFGSEPLGINDPIMKGAEALWNKGITMVAAAGNSGPEFETIKSPGISPRIITVGGFNDNRAENGEFNIKEFSIAPFSSRGPALRRYKPDVVAPSVNITSCSNLSSSDYTKMSGTSVATPMVAGLAALMLEKEPRLSPDQVKLRLMSVATPISFNRNLEGAGFPFLK